MQLASLAGSKCLTNGLFVTGVNCVTDYIASPFVPVVQVENITKANKHVVDIIDNIIEIYE
jgi:hypothetical protein